MKHSTFCYPSPASMEKSDVSTSRTTITDKLCDVTNNYSNTPTSATGIDLITSIEEDMCEYKVKNICDGGSRNIPLPEICLKCTAQSRSKLINTFQPSNELNQLSDYHQETIVSETPTKRRHAAPDEDSEFESHSKKNNVFFGLNHRTENNMELCFTDTNILFSPAVIMEEKLNNEFNRSAGEESEEHIFLLVQMMSRFESAAEFELQSKLEASHKFGNLNPSTDFQENSIAVLGDKREPEFKIPQKRPKRRAINVKAKTVIDEHGDKPKDNKGFKNSKCKAAEKAEFKHSSIAKDSVENIPSSITKLNHETNLYIPSSTSKLSNETNLCIPSSTSKLSNKTNLCIPSSTSKLSNETDLHVALGNELNDPCFIEFYKSLANQQQEEHNLLVEDAKRVEIFISQRLEVLERHIHYFYNELNAIPPWSQRLKTVLRHLAKHRSRKTCSYLAERYNSERRRPLSQIREQYIDILETLGYGMIDMFDDVRYAFTEGNIRNDDLMINKIRSFWEKISKDYEQFRLDFYKMCADYPNYNDVCKSMDDHSGNMRDIFFTFQEIIIDLFESF